MDPKEFNDHMWNFNNHGFVLVAINFGKKVGLFDVLMEDNKPMTSKEIADKLDMKERYVREWLGCMVAAQIISLDGDNYYIPKVHNDIIRSTTAWAGGSLSFVKRYELTKACFQKKGPWGHDFDVDDDLWTYYDGFRTLTSAGFIEQNMLPELESLPDFTGKLDSGIDVLDLGCGSGAFTIALGERFPRSKFTGLEPCDIPLKIANKQLQGKSLSNVTFVKGDVYNLGTEMPRKFDLLLVCDVLHDLPDPHKALVEIEKALTAKGKVMIVDIRTHSKHADNAGDLTAAMFYCCSIFVCLQCSLQESGPKVGYGTCWGKEEMEKTIEQVLKIDKSVDLPMLHALFICSKKN